MQFCGPLLAFFLGKLALSSFKGDQFFLCRLKKALTRCPCQLNVLRHVTHPVDHPNYIPNRWNRGRFMSVELRNNDNVISPWHSHCTLISNWNCRIQFETGRRRDNVFRARRRIFLRRKQPTRKSRRYPRRGLTAIFGSMVPPLRPIVSAQVRCHCSASCIQNCNRVSRRFLEVFRT